VLCCVVLFGSVRALSSVRCSSLGSTAWFLGRIRSSASSLDSPLNPSPSVVHRQFVCLQLVTAGGHLQIMFLSVLCNVGLCR